VTTSVIQGIILSKSENVQDVAPLQLHEITIFTTYTLFINIEDIYLIDLEMQEKRSNVTYTQKFYSNQTFANCFSLYSNQMSCYLENEILTPGSWDYQDPVQGKEKYLVEFVAPTQTDIYRLPPIRLLIGDDAILETVFFNFLLLRYSNNTI